MHRLAAILIALALVTPSAIARGSGSHSSKESSNVAASSHDRATPGIVRDSHGRIMRSEHVKREFRKSHPCPSTGKTAGACPGYVIDHISPLKRGGADAPYNMQWQTIEAAKDKDRQEYCGTCLS
jgi:hypothetical protein